MIIDVCYIRGWFSQAWNFLWVFDEAKREGSGVTSEGGRHLHVDVKHMHVWYCIRDAHWRSLIVGNVL